jgi:hypothetical protein
MDFILLKWVLELVIAREQTRVPRYGDACYLFI